jgi:2-dehydropantoate 2-reductase
MNNQFDDQLPGLRIAVVGVGGVGGVCAASLVQAGYSVTGVSANESIADAIHKNGLRTDIEGQSSLTRFPVHAVLPPDTEKFQIALLAMPPNHMQLAVKNLLPFLSEDAILVCFQNGLAEERLSLMYPDQKIVGGIVSYGASMWSPGHVEKTSPGGYTLGSLSGGIDDSMRLVARVLADCDPVEISQNLRGARWSKLAINCAISSLGTIGGQRLGSLMRYRFVRRLCLETMTEVTQVAIKDGVALEKVAGTLDLEWLALDADERLSNGSPSLIAKHAILLAVGAKYRRLRSSMLSAIERGREPPIDFLNQEVVNRAAAHDIPAPINKALVEQVRRIASGDASPSLKLLKELFEETRPELRSLSWAA